MKKFLLLAIVTLSLNVSFAQEFVWIPFTHPKDINTDSEKWVRIDTNVYGYAQDDSLSGTRFFDQIIFDDSRNKLITYANTEGSVVSNTIYTNIKNFIQDMYGPPVENQNFAPEYLSENPTDQEWAVAINRGHAHKIERWDLEGHQVVIIWTKDTGISLVFDFHKKFQRQYKRKMRRMRKN